MPHPPLLKKRATAGPSLLAGPAVLAAVQMVQVAAEPGIRQRTASPKAAAVAGVCLDGPTSTATELRRQRGAAHLRQ